MRTTCITISIATLLGLSACSDLHCLDTERKVGAVCYPKTRTVDASATAAEDDAGADASQRDARTERQSDADTDTDTDSDAARACRRRDGRRRDPRR